MKADPLSPWTQFPVGAVVRISPKSGGSTAGATGVVAERLDDRIDGLCRYAVRVDLDRMDGAFATVDVCRCELSRAHAGTGPRRRVVSKTIKEPVR